MTENRFLEFVPDFTEQVERGAGRICPSFPSSHCQRPLGRVRLVRTKTGKI